MVMADKGNNESMKRPMNIHYFRIHSTPKSAVRRKRPLPSATATKSSTALLLALFLPLTAPYTVTWNFGPEDHFFCGFSWDDPACSTRQNCRSGKSEECDGFARGEVCYKDTPCDSAAGGGRDYVEGKWNTVIPTFSPTIVEAMPTATPATIGPTLIPTEFPIGPPPDLDYPSDDPTDHWYCGIGIDDANERCSVHCPSASECPVGQICYFGTRCDARTHAPTPPPTHRPTRKPTPRPTESPTVTAVPTIPPTTTMPPSEAPTMPLPTQSPTPSPTQSPTHGPLTAIQSGFFCATDWNDAITNCKMRCPSGEDPECPVGEFCFAYTGCTEEKGYPNGRPPMRGEVDQNATDVDEDGDSGSQEGGECVELKVVIVADDWPAEISWDVTNKTGDIVALGTNDKLTSGSPADYTECLLKKECYEFTIHDTGGDGICCDHGEGSYEVYFEGKQVKKGGAYYDAETTEFGMCDETSAPTENAGTRPPSPAPESTKTDAKPEVSRPTGGSGVSVGSVSASGGSVGSSSGSIYRCVQKDLLDQGYTVKEPLCSQFVDCFNGFINMGDDWFCEDGEVCTESPGCASPNEGGGGNGAEEQAKDDAAEEQTVQGQSGQQDVQEQELEFQITESPVSIIPSRPALRPTVSKPKPTASTTSPVTSNPTSAHIGSTRAPIASTPSPIVSTPSPVTPTPPPIAITPEPSLSLSTDEPTAGVTTASPSLSPTTSMPTLGPCDGEPCNRDDYCRSQHGYCGPGETYCNKRSIWTVDCRTAIPTVTGSTSTLTDTTQSPTLSFNEVGKPSFQKPSGGSKPGGGKVPATEPELDQLTNAPTEQPTENKITLPPTAAATGFSTFMLIGSRKDTDSPTPTPMLAPTPAPVNFVTISSGIDMEVITSAPTPGSTESMQATSAILDTASKVATVESSIDSTTDEATNDFECTGEPCDQSTWCRSIYGSCGPGFIYCNSKAIWTSSCPPVAPGSTPTKGPTVSPDSTTEQKDSGIDSTAAPVQSPTLSLPELPKPTLPTITNADSFAFQQALEAHGITQDAGHQLDKNKTSVSTDQKDKKKPTTPANTYATEFESPEFAKQWGDWAATVSSAPRSYPYIMYFAVLLSLSTILFSI
eukprot:CCRYP_011028-RA/>CCRYP_011028-RA protein AED:0.13 eAED:0.13 QI:434/1/0.6/1/0.5/0.4/5/3085/1111